MDGWLPYEAVRGRDHTVRGTVLVRRDVASPQLGNSRDLLVYLPPGYGRGGSWPLLLMHDGQNVFDERTSYAGEWRADETLEALAAEGLGAVVVAVPNADDGRPTGGRLDEYSPWPTRFGGGGRGHAYLAFLEETVVPLVEAAFRVRRDRAGRLLGGSSMGGLISLVGLLTRPGTWGGALVASPAFHAAEEVYALAERAPLPHARLWMDVGTAEGEDAEARAAYVAGARRMSELLTRRGWTHRFRVVEGAAHHEAAWAERLPEALRFLLAGTPAAPPGP